MSSGEGSAYVPKRLAQSRFMLAREVRYHLREWGDRAAPLAVFLHGARDSSASFQFVVDALERDWHVLAPDWRGHGQSGWVRGGYWLADFLCDLDALLRECSGDQPVVLVGHSMGGNIASLYAGVRPGRVARLVMLDALGNPPDRDPVNMVELLDHVLETEVAPAKYRTFQDTLEMAQHLRRTNHRLDAGRAQFLASQSSRALPSGGLVWPWDPAFRRSWPSLHSSREWADCWQRITAPVLALIASDLRPNSATANLAAVQEQARIFREMTVHVVPETGHNVHIDAPAFVARQIESFLNSTQ
jgi:pimeloyl-ACP methyl ester carboxylesterase